MVSAPGSGPVTLRALAASIPLLAAAASPAMEPPVCRYDVEVMPEPVLEVAVTCDASVRGLQPANRYSRGYVRVSSAGRIDGQFSARYRVDLAAMAHEIASADAAMASGESILAAGASWLLGPVGQGTQAGDLEIRVVTPPGVGFVTAQPLSDGVFRIAASELAMAGFSAFGQFRRHPVRVGPAATGGPPETFEVIVLDGPLALPDRALLEWISRGADVMARFWRGFPAPDMKIFVVPRAGAEGVVFGRDMAGGGVSMLLIVGERATRAQLDDDWVLIHELVHAGSPFVMGAPWLTEGLATYFEPLIRARYGLQSPAAMWTEFITHMPRGAAVIGETGLVRGGFRGWYWGGGLLMLLGDVEIRRATGGRLGLEDCLRGVRTRIGNYLRTVRLEEMVAACDAEVGGMTLARLVERHARSASEIDLDALWRDLGVSLVGKGLEIDDGAPLAHIRKAIVRGGLGKISQ